MPIFITNHPNNKSMTYFVPSIPISIHRNQITMHIHILHTLNRVLQPSIQPTIKNLGKNIHSCTNLAYAMDPCSGERGLSLKLQGLA